MSNNIRYFTFYGQIHNTFFKESLLREAKSREIDAKVTLGQKDKNEAKVTLVGQNQEIEKLKSYFLTNQTAKMFNGEIIGIVEEKALA